MSENMSEEEISIIELIKRKKKSISFNQIKNELKINDLEKLSRLLKNMEINKLLSQMKS